jgi:DNA-directed RNA polymerase specialized sigma24 family protein
MSVESGGGCTGDDRTAEALRSAGHYVFSHLYENYAARLFDYCVGILRDELAAVIAVEDTLVAVDEQISVLPDPGQLRVLLYSTARRDCLNKLPRHRVTPLGESETAAQGGFAAEQAAPDEEADADDAPILAAALGRLTDSDQEVLSLAYRHGIQGADLAAVLDVSPRRARMMLADARGRFRKAAAAGRGDRVLEPEMIDVLPLVRPPLTLRLRISLALGSYRRADADLTSASGAHVVRVRHAAPHRAPQRMVVLALGLVMLAVLGAVLYRFVLTSPARTEAAGVTAGIPGPAPATSAQLPPGLAPQGSVRQQKLGSFPGFPGPIQMGVLPSPSPTQSGTPPTSGGPPPTTPPPTRRPPTTPPPTTPPPTTPPPTTPPPTTPPPTTPPPTTPPPTTPPPTTPPPTTPPPTTPPPTGGTPTPTA